MAGVRITQLHPQHATGRRYGSFAGKSAGASTQTYARLIVGDEDDGSDDWWQEYEA